MRQQRVRTKPPKRQAAEVNGLLSDVEARGASSLDPNRKGTVLKNQVEKHDEYERHTQQPHNYRGHLSDSFGWT